MIICFDLDGTLVDSEKWIVNSFQGAFKKNGKKIPTKKKIFNNWGITCGQLIKKCSTEKLTKKESEKIRKDFYIIREKTKSMIRPFPHTIQILKRLNKKYHLAIVSNNPHKEILKILKKTKIDKNLFEVIIGDNEVKKAKPFPDELFAVEKKFNKKIKFMIGDTLQDIKTAKSAKVKSIIIKNGPKQSWKNLKKANFIIESIKDLPDLIKEERNGSTT